MNRIKKAFSSRLGFSLITNAIALFISIVLFRPYWEEIDDIWIAVFTEGAFGDNEPHVLFSNIIYGQLLCIFQRAIPNIRWHAVFELLFIFAISTAFVYVLSKDKRGRFLSIVFLLGSFYEICVALQFSKIPTFIAMAGYMILFELCSDNDITKKQKMILRITAWISILYAILLRPESFLLATMVAGIYGVIRVIREITKKEFTARFRTYCIHFVPIALLFIVCTFVDRMSYTSPEWVEFKGTWDYSESMIDYHHDVLIYSKHAKELENIGVSENDVFVFITWQYGDDEFLNADLLQKIIAIDQKGIGSIDIDMIKAWIANIHETIFAINPLILGFVMMLGIYLSRIISGKEKSFAAALLVAQMLITVGVLFWYQYSGRWSHRIVYALLIAQFILILYLLNEEQEQSFNPALMHCVTAVLLFAVISMRLTNEFDYQEYKRTVFDHQAVISYMQQNKDKLFAVDTFTLQDLDKYSVFKASQKGQFDNMTLTGGAYTNSPMTKRITRSHGYENPYKALEARDKNVILVDNLFSERKLKYCNEHGDGNDYSLESIDTIGGLHLYNIL